MRGPSEILALHNMEKIEELLAITDEFSEIENRTRLSVLPPIKFLVSPSPRMSRHEFALNRIEAVAPVFGFKVPDGIRRVNGYPRMYITRRHHNLR